MTYLEATIMAIWFTGTLALFVWWGNEMRQALNNLSPGVRLSDYAETSYFGFRFFPAPSSRRSLPNWDAPIARRRCEPSAS